MRRRASVLMCALALAMTSALSAQKADKVSATLVGTNEIPAVSTPAQGTFEAEIHDTWVEWTLTYSGLQAPVAQSHIHFAQPFANGGIVVWLCKTTQSPPTPTADCPVPGGSVSGTFDASDVVTVTSQGITANDFAEVVEAMRSGLAYVNVHTSGPNGTGSPGGEIRGQIKAGAGH